MRADVPDRLRRQLVQGIAAAPVAGILPIASASEPLPAEATAWTGPIGQAAASLGVDRWVEVSTDGLFAALTPAGDNNQMSVAEYMDGMYAPQGLASLVLAGGGRDVWDEGTRYVRYDDATGAWSAVDYGGRFEGHSFAGTAIRGKRLFLALRDDLTEAGDPIPRVFTWDLRRPMSFYGDASGYSRLPYQLPWEGQIDWSGFPNAAVNPLDPGAIYVWQWKAGGLKRIDLRTGAEQVIAADFPDCTMGAFEGLMSYCPGLGEILIGGGIPRKDTSVQMWAVAADGSYRRLPDVPVQRRSATGLRDGNGDEIYAPQFGCRQNATSDNLLFHPVTGLPLLWTRIDQRMLTYNGEAWVEAADPVYMPPEFRDYGVEYISGKDYWGCTGQSTLMASIPALGVVAVVTTVNFEARLWLWRPPLI